jgi:hypothetical protein
VLASAHLLMVVTRLLACVRASYATCREWCSPTSSMWQTQHLFLSGKAPLYTRGWWPTHLGQTQALCS